MYSTEINTLAHFLSREVKNDIIKWIYVSCQINPQHSLNKCILKSIKIRDGTSQDGVTHQLRNAALDL